MLEILIEIKDLKKEYISDKHIIKALDGVSLDIYKGEILGLLGVNGAGKTTLSSIIATLHPSTSGDIIFGGRSIYEDINSYRRFIGFCPQKPNLISDLTLEQNLLFAGRYFEMPEEQIRKRIDFFTQKYKLVQYLYLKPSVLSGGYRQRVMIVRSLMHNPKLLILDEPTAGLDPNIRHQLWEEIRALKKEGVTIILTTHYIDEAEILSDRICILDKGRIKLVDTPENLKSVYHQSRLEDVFLKLMHEEIAE